MSRTKIKIESDGRVRIEGKDFPGKTCAAAIGAILRKLGVDPNSVTPDWDPDVIAEDTAETVSGG